MRTITLIVTAGIAAYKVIELVRLLRKNGDCVVPIMTESAKEFITPLTLEVIAEHQVYDTLFEPGRESRIGHIQLARQSDLVVVAPCSAHFMAQYALGLAEDLPSTLLLANTASVLLAPAMNHRMWQAEPTRQHVSALEARGVHFVGPKEGDMACGEYGVGRMAEPEEIFGAIQRTLGAKQELLGKKVLVTGGPTREAIDPVRYMSNHSSGKMAKSLVSELTLAGAEVVFVHGPISSPPTHQAHCIAVQTAQEMYDNVIEQKGYDVFIAAAAVADWRVARSAEKLRKISPETPHLRLVENPDILASVARSKHRPKLVIGFAAETSHDVDALQEKLLRKGCDWLLSNTISAQNPVFGCEDNHLWFFAKDAKDVRTQDWGRGSKQALARRLTQEIVGFFSVKNTVKTNA